MVISEQQLEVWSHTGADTGAKMAYDRVKNILSSSNFSKKSEVDIFLQGSYANTTHIRADSDVDVIIRLTTVINSDISRLSELQKQEHSKLPNSTYGHYELRQELVSVFKSILGHQNVEEHKKCIRLNLGDSYLSVDVIPCLSYRVYRAYPSDYIEGISIKKTDGTIIYNFPKQHIENGTKKHQATNEYYKKIVRIFKNMRNKLIEEGKLEQNVAPSYFIECLFYNIPNNNFGSNLQNSVLNSIKWLLDNNGDLSNLKCQNEITQLFGSEETQWNTNDCHAFLIAVSKLFVGGQNV